MILQAPVPNLETTTVLPNPQFGDSQARQHKVDLKQSMNGVLYTYVKSNARSKLVYTLTLHRMKALELRAFIQSYYRSKIRLTNHKGEIWDGYFTSNPFEFSGDSGGPDDEMTSITIEFQGTLVQGVTPEACN